MRSAAETDKDIEALLEESDQERLQRMRRHAQFLRERGYLRRGVTVSEATDIPWTCSSVELNELLVLRRGRSLRRFAQFLTTFLTTALLPDLTAQPSGSG